MEEDKRVMRFAIRELGSGVHELSIGNFLITLQDEKEEASKPKAAPLLEYKPIKHRISRKFRCKVKVNGKECGKMISKRQKGGHMATHSKLGHLKSKSN